MDERIQGTHCPCCGQQNGVIAFYLCDLPCYKCPDCNGWGRWDNPDGSISYRRAVSAAEQLCNCGEFCNKSLGQPHAGKCRRVENGLPVKASEHCICGDSSAGECPVHK